MSWSAEEWLSNNWFPFRWYATTGADPLSNVYPAASVVPRKTSVSRIPVENYDVAIDGTVRLLDPAARAAYQLQITHAHMNAAQLETLRTFFAAWSRRDVLVVDAQSRGYICRLPAEPDDVAEVAQGSWSATLTLSGVLTV